VVTRLTSHTPFPLKTQSSATINLIDPAMRPLDDMFASPTSASSSSTRPNKSSSHPASIIASRSPSPGTRPIPTAAGGPGLTTFFLTEENNFGVHSMTESHLSNTSTSQNATTSTEIIPKVDDVGKTGTVDVMGAIPTHVFGHVHTPSIGSNMSPTISTPSSPQHNLSSSAISDDSELDISSQHEAEEQESVSVSVGDSVSSNFPQLVMPRVNMPRRKAFTEPGRTMGKLKVMIVGDSGSPPNPFVGS
jgi:hypothetical protein